MRRSPFVFNLILIIFCLFHLAPTLTIGQSTTRTSASSSYRPVNANSNLPRSGSRGIGNTSKWTRTTRRTTTTTTTPPPPPIEELNYDTEDELQDTLDLLTEGETEIVLDPRYKDVILMMGNTGAGKSTIGQFLTGNNADLESYEGPDGHFLIRDKLQKISENSTLVSKSIFPDLLIHPERQQVAFYDYPGFSDTRSPSVEIANAFFMKKVADYARSVKILFIVNYSSLKIGQNRLDFKNMMEHALNFLKEPAKFSRGLALIATKVEYPEMTDVKLVRGIAKFLESVIDDLPTFYGNSDSDLARAESLIEALLTKDRHGGYGRIGLFRQPNQLGPLNQIVTTQGCKPMMEKIVYQNLQYVPKTADDFGVTISPRAVLLVKNLAEKYNDNIDALISNLGERMEEHFTNLVQNEADHLLRLGLFSRLTRDWQDLDRSMGQLSGMAERKEFLTKLVHTVRHLEVNGSESILVNLLRADETLDFFLRTGEAAFPARTAKWLQPIGKTHTFLAQRWLDLGSRINEDMGQAVETLAEKTRINFDQKIQANPADGRQVNQDLRRAHQLVNGVIEDIEGTRDFQTIFDTLSNFIVESNLSTENDPPAFATIFFEQETETRLDDQVDGKLAPFLPADWVKPLKNLLIHFEAQRHAVAQKMNIAVDNLVKKVGAELTRIYRSNWGDQDDAVSQKNLNELYENLKEEFSQFYTFTSGLKNSKFLTQFLTGLVSGVQRLSAYDQITPAVLSELRQMAENGTASFQKIEEIDLTAPINGQTSPYKLHDWLSPLESALVILQTRIAEVARKLGETASEQRMGEMMAEKNAMDEKLSGLMERQETLAQKQEEERRAWRQREQELVDREREERIRRDEEARQWRRDEAERADRLRAEADARIERLQAAQIQLMSQQNRREDRNDLFSMAAGAVGSIAAGIGSLFG